MAFIGVVKTSIMYFKFLIISIVITSGFVGSAFAQQSVQLTPQEFSQEEIDEMKHRAVLFNMYDGTLMIELFPEDAPNTVNNFLKLVESGYYDGIVFHRIIPGFVVQAGDPNTKDPEADRSKWGQGGSGYQINEEFNTLQHDRGIVSMARGDHPDTASSQFFIVHKDSNFLDGDYTTFGRLVTGTYSFRQLDNIANLATDSRDAPLDVLRATIIEATILDPYTAAGFADPDRNESIIKKIRTVGGEVDNYFNYLHKVSFDLPYRWDVVEGTGDYLNLVVEPDILEHNVQAQIEEGGFIPQILITSEERNPSRESAGVSTGLFLIKGGEEPKVLSNYIFENDDGIRAHVLVTTQDMINENETFQFKVIQLHFLNSELSYSIIYVNLADWFRYEVNAFVQTVTNFEVVFDGKMQPINFAQSPVFRQLIADAKAEPEPEPIPPARIGGCLIATASYGSELATQVQQLRELRDNTVLQTESGSVFMAGFNQFYYSFSPAVADYERQNSTFKEAVKLTLTPLLTSLTLLQYADIDSESEMLGYGIGIILLNIGMYFVAPAILIMKVRSFYKLQ
uniref:peptidylprolyl isomerase n=2 Tax=environmental samples TaxID=651140 RepID=A0A075I089_9ARCH|nr:peptidyl-prolyl isomerase (PPIB, ppiB) [uncultured marine thaumarchaeote KM3_86_G02]